MCSQLEKEDYLIQVRDKLRKDGIKLWLPPYVNQSNSISKEDVKESGLATIKIKILLPNTPPKIVTKELLLSLQASELKRIINQEVKFPADRLKLISAGKVLNDTSTLDTQGVRNGQLILAITISETPTQVLETENQIKELENVKTDSRLLALDNEFMQLEDQFGNAIKIPSSEKKALIVAMTLHEKGKSALKRRDYSRALVFFLEADEEFRHCNSQLLNTVDNYALLNLDIAWCYLCLESFAHLPEAYDRLKKCEEKFHSTYGPNLERLIAVKGTPGSEEALFMRLHLLQAIVLYHQNKRTEALALLKKAEGEIQNLKVDENSLTALIELGYSPAEATLGLRATKGDVNLAANYINENKEKRAERRKKAKAEEILIKERKKLGKCADGKQYVDANFVKILVNMGYNKEAARIALQKNEQHYIGQYPVHPRASFAGTQRDEKQGTFLEAAGFDSRMAKLALQKHSGDIMKAAEELLANNGIISGDLTNIITPESIQNIKKKKLEHDEKNEAFKRLAEDISIVDDDYLDIDLVQEETFLKQYLSLLERE
ncbi:hypothetical protein NQ315_007727 [Exocentrus adspersus]|uniref:NEDD8 ultimate buster 1 n=1 Tax=Exocentrus adspersus TaxID=1586481 RepID=A0AAV8W8I7_9CUCU|nr:hypothetical protein NQ315_007727 [Exocentrus adspersus]